MDYGVNAMSEEKKQTIEEIRVEIDDVDQKMKELFLQRMELTDAVAEIKAESGGAVYQPGREKAMLDRLAVSVEPRFQESYIRFLKGILSISKDYQNEKLKKIRG